MSTDKNKLIPELRFPEFLEDGDWVEKKLGDKEVSYFVNEKTPVNKLNIDSYISTENMIPEFSGVSTSSKLPSLGSFTKFKNGDILISNIRPYLKKVWKADKIGGASNDVLVFRSGSFVLSEFLECIIKNEAFINYVMESAKGVKMPRGDKNSMQKYIVFIPSQTEQQKIASCLSSLDEVITAQNQKLDTLKDHKKGLMQNLFPTNSITNDELEITNVPNYRFPEFLEDGDWEEKRLGELIDVKGRIGYRGYTLADIVNKGEGAISMSPSNINKYGTLNFTKSTYITWAKYEESPEIILKNDFTVLVKTGSTFGKVAFIKNLSEKTTINPQLVVLKPTKIDSFFLYLIISNSSVQGQINATVVGGAIPTLSQDSISKFEVLIPKPKEQQKIASCLSSLEDLITAQTEKIAQLKLHKKGLMQGLFPKSITN
jgi:type I restriction enzyme S subunit